MNEQDILNALGLGEERDWEFKSAKGGIPDGLWETYSAMANTDGGCVVLGVEYAEGRYRAAGLPDPAKAKKSFWDTINNRSKVNINLLTDALVSVQQVQGRPVMVIRVPRATRQQRPVYLGQNPLLGTYRRNYEGDYHCTEQEVARMLADRGDEPADSRILEGFDLADLDEASLQQYRNRFSSRLPTHAWLAEDTTGFLSRLGAWRKDRTTGQEGLTVAGLLMFGKDGAIRDPKAIPDFNLDYRERLSDEPAERWTDRVTVDGTWVANVFQFYQRAIVKLTTDLKIPFKLDPDLFRKDDTPVHEAIREALVNALIHADYRGAGGIIIEKYRDRFELSNPGTLLVSWEQLLRGGVSECRNKSLQQMFVMIGGGERAGSGIDRIRQGWNSQRWRSPSIRETVQPDRVRLIMPMVSLLPPESLDRLKGRFGKRVENLGPLETQALVTAEMEGSVSNARMREICGEHPADLTKMLRGLVAKGLLAQEGQKRGTSYRLPSSRHAGGLSSSSAESIGEESVRYAETPHTNEVDSVHYEGTPYVSTEPDGVLESLTEEQRRWLEVIAAPSQPDTRLRPGEARQIILALCEGIYLTAVEIGILMHRNPNALRLRLLTPMVSEGLLTRKYPDDPNRPDQAYTTGGRRSS